MGVVKGWTLDGEKGEQRTCWRRSVVLFVLGLAIQVAILGLAEHRKALGETPRANLDIGRIGIPPVFTDTLSVVAFQNNPVVELDTTLPITYTIIATDAISNTTYTARVRQGEPLILTSVVMSTTVGGICSSTIITETVPQGTDVHDDVTVQVPTAIAKCDFGSVLVSDPITVTTQLGLRGQIVVAVDAPEELQVSKPEASMTVANGQVISLTLGVIDQELRVVGETRTVITDTMTTVIGESPCDYLDPKAIFGTAGNDLLIGTHNRDIIFGMRGNDLIVGLSGDDCIDTGPGDDKGFGGRGQDTVSGFSGNDRLFGGQDNDVLIGGPNHDALFGNKGSDWLDGGQDRDSLFGGGGRKDTDTCLNGEVVIGCEWEKL